jgi:hypothetical protein
MVERGRRAIKRVRLIVGAAGVALLALLALVSRRQRHRRSGAITPTPAGPSAEELRRRGHEPNSAVAGVIVALGVGMVVLAVIMHAGLWGMQQVLVTVPPTSLSAVDRLNAPLRDPGVPTPTVPSLPERLPVGPDAAQRLQAETEATLTSYGWVDRDRGVVHIPIDRAIELLIERGLPAREGGER